MSDHLHVIKRDGTRVPVSFDQILSRIQGLANGLEHVNPDLVAQKVCSQLSDGMKTSALDEFAAETCAMMQARHHPNYGTLAARIEISNYQKNTPSTLKECANLLANYLTRQHVDLAQDPAYEEMIDYSRDFSFDYFGFKTLQKGYLLKLPNGTHVERPQHMWMRVAIQLHVDNLPKVKETYDALSLGYFIHATPTLFNSGTQHAQLSSCFLVSMSEDSIKGIYETLGECAQISKWAGGVGLNIHDIRAKDADIVGTNGKSTGIVPMLKVYNDTAKYVNQGGKRNGSFAIYLEPWHSDVEEFLRLRLNTGTEDERARDLFYAMWIPDLFMKRVDAGEDWSLMSPDVCHGLADTYGAEFETLYLRYESEGHVVKKIPAKKLWQQILDTQIQTGMPYLCYKDAANLKSNQSNLGTIRSSNLCVAPETMILTDMGQFPIASLKNQTVRVWNGDAFSETVIRQTGIQQELIDVVLNDGRVLTCTPYHKFLVSKGYTDKTSIKHAHRVPASELQVGMCMKKGELPTIVCGTELDFLYPYTHGFFCGDGTYSNGRPTLSLYGEKKELVPHLQIKSMTGIPDASGRFNTSLPIDLERKFRVPLNTSLQCRLAWLAGYLDADGCVCRNGTNESLQAASIDYTFLQNIQSMLVTMGVHSKIRTMHPTRKTMLPDGHGGYAEFECKHSWRLLISSVGLYHLSTLGFKTHRLQWTARNPQREANHFVTVSEIVHRRRVDDTFCFTEPRNNAGVFNGILTGNCSEIIEFSSPDETAVCNLGSLSLPSFIRNGAFDFTLLHTYTRILANNLDLVIDQTFYPTKKCKKSNLRHRPIGIGVQGLADVFARLRISWTSPEAARLNRTIFEVMYHAALTESAHLAKKYGAYASYAGCPASRGKLQYDLWNDPPKYTPFLDWNELKTGIQATGLRNSLSIALMPTASTSQILGNNECFEPFTSNLYTRRVLAGEFMVTNKYLVSDLVERSLWTAEVRSQLIANNGSVQGIAGIPSELRELYKNVWEIPQKILIDMSRDRAPFVCQSQSLNLFVAEPSFSKLSSMHFYAWRAGLKTGCYYLRTKAVAKAQQFTVEPENCLSCSA